MPRLLAAYPDRFRSRWLGAASLAGFAVFAYLTRSAEGHRYLDVPLIMFAFTLCLYTIAAAPWLPLSRFFVLLGTYSFSLYLFHEAYFELLKSWGLLVPHRLASVAYALLFFPLFLLVCVMVEKGFTFWRREFINLFSWRGRAVEDIES
jgi:peptidoglycan/LPS O-acetylase OafA/YrhL